MKTSTIVIGAVAGLIGANLVGKLVVKSGGTIGGTAFLVAGTAGSALKPFWLQNNS